MGILRYFVLPTFGLVHVAAIYACKDVMTFGGIIRSADVATELDEKSIRQKTMLGTIRGLNAAMLCLCGWSVFAKACHSDTRKVIAMAETVLFTCVTADAMHLKTNHLINLGLTLLALGGSIIDSLEPGIYKNLFHNISSTSSTSNNSRK